MEQNQLLNFPDNLVLHLERDRRNIKVFTTEKRLHFKVLYGLWDADSVVDTTYIDLRQLKQLLVDSCINGFTIKSNMIFEKGLLGVAKELAKEREEQLKVLVTEISKEVVDEEVAEKHF